MTRPQELAVTLTVAQLEELMKRAVREAGAGAPSEIMTREEVAAMLQLHVNVVGKFVKTEGLPACHVGGALRFVRSEVLAWVQSHHGAPVRKARRKGEEAA